MKLKISILICVLLIVAVAFLTLERTVSTSSVITPIYTKGEAIEKGHQILQESSPTLVDARLLRHEEVSKILNVGAPYGSEWYPYRVDSPVWAITFAADKIDTVPMITEGTKDYKGVIFLFMAESGALEQIMALTSIADNAYVKQIQALPDLTDKLEIKPLPKMPEPIDGPGLPAPTSTPIPTK